MHEVGAQSNDLPSGTDVLTMNQSERFGQIGMTFCILGWGVSNVIFQHECVRDF